MRMLDDTRLQVGDIILSTQERLASKVVRGATKSDNSHAMLYVARGSAIDSAPEGVHARSTGRMFFDASCAVHVRRLSAAPSEAQRALILEHARTHIGIRYSKSEAVRAAVGTARAPSRQQFCSRLVAQAYEHAGVRLVEVPDYCTPEELENSPLLQAVPDALVEVSDVYVARVKSDIDTNNVMRAATNTVLAAARNLASGIESLGDIDAHLLEHPSDDDRFARVFEESGYLTAWHFCRRGALPVDTRHTIRMFMWLVAALLLPAMPASADSFDFPPGFRTQEVATNGTLLHVRIGGAGPAVILIHGYGDTGDMWAPLAAVLMQDHTVIAPDLRGMGLSAPATGGFTKKNQAEDIAGVMNALHIERADVVGHDIGNMVAFAFAEAHQERTTRLVMMDAPVPGIGPWEEILSNPLLWHFRFGGPDMERLVAGRERIYLDRFWNEFSANPAHFPETSRRHYAALYARPGRMHAGFLQFAAFDQDVIDNRASLKLGRLQMPVLAIGGDHSFGATMAFVMRFAADDVHQVVIPQSGHWLMEEQPQATVAAIRGFLNSGATLPDVRLTATEVNGRPRDGAGAGTSGLSGIQTTVLSGDPNAPGPYAFEIRVPAHARIAAHRHRDNRTALVVSGEWHFGYGELANEAASKTLGPGGFYTEPAGRPHFAFTGDLPTVVYITGQGPTDTTYVVGADAPPHN